MEDLTVVGVDVEAIARRFDPSPTIDSRDPDAYRKYAKRLDTEVPNWFWTDLSRMVAELSAEAYRRRTEPVLQSEVRLCVTCDKDLSNEMGCYVMYRRSGGGFGVAPDMVLICVECRQGNGQTFAESEYHNILTAAGKRRWAREIELRRTHIPRLSVREYIIDAFKPSPSGTFLTLPEIAVQGDDGTMSAGSIASYLIAVSQGMISADSIPGITPGRDDKGRLGARKE